MIKVKKEQMLVFVFIFGGFLFGAENSPLEGGEIDPPPAAPIDVYVPLLFFAGILLFLHYKIKMNFKNLNDA